MQPPAAASHSDAGDATTGGRKPGRMEEQTDGCERPSQEVHRNNRDLKKKKTNNKNTAAADADSASVAPPSLLPNYSKLPHVHTVPLSLLPLSRSLARPRSLPPSLSR